MPASSAGAPGAVSVGALGPVRRRPRRVPALLGLALVVGAAGTAGTLVAARQAIDSVQRVSEVDGVLSDAPSAGEVENFLLVGSDTREGADPDDPDFGGIGDTNTVSGARSDTVMVLRTDPETGTASLLSIPRDLWVPIPGHGSQRINAAYNFGPAVLVQTVRESLGLPIHHYIEIDFQGFKSLVDAIGGYQHCSMVPARDTHTGFDFPVPGCFVIDGTQALAYARSRFYETYDEATGQWNVDGRADIGRTERQREFVKKALQLALDEAKANPFLVGDILTKAGGSLRVDENLDVMDAVSSLRDAVSDIRTFELPVVGTTIDGNAVLELTGRADATLAYFRGDGPAPE